ASERYAGPCPPPSLPRAAVGERRGTRGHRPPARQGNLGAPPDRPDRGSAPRAGASDRSARGKTSLPGARLGAPPRAGRANRSLARPQQERPQEDRRRHEGRPLRRDALRDGARVRLPDGTPPQARDGADPPDSSPPRPPRAPRVRRRRLRWSPRPAPSPHAFAARRRGAPARGAGPSGPSRRDARLPTPRHRGADGVHAARAPGFRGGPERASMRVLGVDFGLRRIGLALSDEGGSIATPLRSLAISSVRDAPAAVAQAAREAGAEAVVVGAPLGLEGEEG